VTGPSEGQMPVRLGCATGDRRVRCGQPDALGHNPVPFVVPCHRVVRSDWTLGEYSAGGTEVKERVLRAEGVTPEKLDWLRHAPRYIGQLQTHEFCLAACPGLDEEDPATHRAFRSTEEALEEGYVPCEVCKPA